MSALPAHWAEKDEITREDLLKAMEKLSHIIESDKQTDHDQNHNYYYESPGKNAQYGYRLDSENYRDINYLNEPELIENVKAAAKDLSELVHRNDEYDRSLRKSVLSNSHYDRENNRQDSKLSSTINRLYELDSKKKERIAALQFQKYKEELGSLKTKPEISLNSKILAENKGREPIYQRSQAIIRQKEENLTRLKKHIEETRNEREPPPTFQPNLVSKRSIQQDDSRIRSAKEFTSQVYAWQTKRQETIQKEQYENLTKELEELTFKPKINKKSLELATKKRGEKEPVEVRLQKLKEQYDDKMKERREREKPTFRPILNEKSVNLSRNRKNNIENMWKNKNRDDLSFVNVNQGSGELPMESYENSRSLTPGRSTNRLDRKSYNNNKGSKTPRVHEIEYTPAMDFLLKKIS